MALKSLIMRCKPCRGQQNRQHCESGTQRLWIQQIGTWSLIQIFIFEANKLFPYSNFFCFDFVLTRLNFTPFAFISQLGVHFFVRVIKTECYIKILLLKAYSFGIILVMMTSQDAQGCTRATHTEEKFKTCIRILYSNSY